MRTGRGFDNGCATMMNRLRRSGPRRPLSAVPDSAHSPRGYGSADYRQQSRYQRDAKKNQKLKAEIKIPPAKSTTEIKCGLEIKEIKCTLYTMFFL